MNAKKIMGAVLVALLAAALFVGAGAADTTTKDYGAVFVYEAETGLEEGLWTNGDATVTIGANGNVTAVTNFVPGTYKNASGTLYVGYPAATISGIAGAGKAAYPFIGANLYEGDAVVITNASLSTKVDAAGYLITFPNTTTIEQTETELNNLIPTLPKGTYKIAVYFNYENFTTGADVELLQTTPVTFTIVEADDATITASADQLNKGEVFTITVTGKPGTKYLVNGTAGAFKIPAGQPGISFIGQNATFEMPNNGKVSFNIAGDVGAKEKETLKLWYNGTGDSYWNYTKESITVKFAKGTITAKAEAASYFVGDIVKITGTTSDGEIENVTIKGTNFDAYIIQSTTQKPGFVADSMKLGDGVTQTFEFKINTGLVVDDDKKLDVGTYTLTIETANAKATVALVLKQPFISIAEAPEVIVQGEDAEFVINAEAAEKIGYYIFGTNYFVCSPAPAGITEHPEDAEGEPIENQFLIELDGDDVTSKMAAGQYFAVFQHPMYDGEFNVTGANWVINVNSGEYTIDVKDRQTANAAQALCDALDMQGIDDMYAKASFFIVGKDASFTISEIPTTVAQGETITISGVSTAAAEDYVTVEMISTAFAAVPKETVGSAAFIVVTTQVAEDGTWEVTLDTSDLNVDEYSLKVACEGTTWKNVNINVVEGADTPDTPDTPDVPDTPDTPDTPTEPTTPGFGALAALAGLGAVAVLLLRRE